MNSKCAFSTVPNTWGDLIDIELLSKHYVVTDDGIIEEDEDLAFYEKSIDSLGDVYLGKPYSFENADVIVGEDNYRLANYITKLPHGIVDKKRPGIGATTIEINSKRNSIIVVPTKILAYNKVVKHPNCQYVGSKMGDERKSVSDAEIINYIENKDIKFKKFLVVADSLEKLIKIIGLNYEDMYNNYFLMIDEIDMLQSDANYRPNLETVMDYYFLFNPKNRCLLTATMREFSNPLLEKETRFDLTDHKIKRNINLLHTNNINIAIKRQIESYTDEKKILIAYNSITQILGVIYNLDPELQGKCAILCSDASEKEAGEYYALLNNNQLPNRIVFMTCSYFAGVDIEDSYHLITVSNAARFFQIVSIDKMTQIAGRCRINNGLLSETIIYNTPKDKAIFNDGTFQEMVLNRAHKYLELLKAADNISNGDEELSNLFEMVKKAIHKKSIYKVGGEEITITRTNKDGVDVPAYFNIDSIVEKLILDSGYYMNPVSLRHELSMIHNVTVLNPVMEKMRVSQKEAEDRSSKEIKQLFDSYIEDAIVQLRHLEATGELNEKNLRKLVRHGKRNAREFYTRFIWLYNYVDTELIIEELWKIRADDKRVFKNLNNTVVFWALVDNHPLKIDLSNSIIIGKSYTSNELYDIVRPIVEYHLHIIIKPRAAVSFIKSFYNMERPRSNYKVIGVNPKDFSVYKMRINKDENLIGLFLI